MALTMHYPCSVGHVLLACTSEERSDPDGIFSSFRRLRIPPPTFLNCIKLVDRRILRIQGCEIFDQKQESCCGLERRLIYKTGMIIFSFMVFTLLKHSFRQIISTSLPPFFCMFEENLS